MVLTITVNPSIDKTYILDKFLQNTVNHSHHVILNAGSKGINVSRVVRLLGLDTLALAFYGGMVGEILLSKLNEENISYDLIKAEDFSTRINVKIVDMSTKSFTDINERGTPVLDYDYKRFIDKYREKLPQSEIVVISGSLLPGMANTTYYELIKIAHEYDKPVFLDCGGNVLKESLAARPYLIKPNLKEFEGMLGKSGLGIEEIAFEGRRIIERYGIEYVIVTMGQKGAVGISKNEGYVVAGPAVEVFSTVGAGDAFLSGVCYGHLQGVSFSKQLVIGTSCASAKVTKMGNEVPSLVELFGYVDGCQVIPLEI